jgi:hypothetical protein
MNLAMAIPDAIAVLRVLNAADRRSGNAVRTSRGWAGYYATDPNSERCGVGEPVRFSDIVDAIAAIENRVGLGLVWVGSETTRVFIGQQMPRDGAQHNVYEMPFSKAEDQTRYRD